MRTLLLIAGLLIAGCQKESAAPAECWGRQLDAKSGSRLTFCVSGGDARQTSYFAGRDRKPATCKAAGRVVSRSKDKLSISFDAGSCENGASPAAHSMSCLSAEGRSWACEFSREAKRPGWWVFFPVSASPAGG